jgi:diguanylate cyclase (GGDEF)-like protein
MPEPGKAVRKSRQQSQSPDDPSAAGAVKRCIDIDLDEILTCAVDLACDILGTDTASIALADKEGTLTFRTQRGLSPQFARRWRRMSSEGLTGIVFRTGQSYASPDLQTDEHYSGTALAQEGIRALLLVPLKTGDEVIGCLYIGYRTPHDFSPDEVRLASLFADHVSMSVKSTTLLQQERQQRQRSEALLDVVSAPTLSLSLKQVLVKLCQSVLKLTIGERCGIFIFNEDTHTLDPIMSLGIDDPAMWKKFRASAGLKIPEIRGIGNAIKAQEPVIEEHAPGSQVLPDFWINTFGMKSLALYPLVHREKTIGVLYVDSLSRFVHFPAEEIETLAAIAKQAAVIIENARLFERELRQHQRAEALVDVLTAAASTFSLKEVLTKLCQSVINISVADRCSIFIVDEESRALHPVMSLGIEDEGLWQRFRNPSPGENTTILPENRRLYETITMWEDPIIVEDAATTTLLSRWWVETFNLKSLVHYPLRVKGRTIGMMTVDAFRHHVRFPKEEIDTLAAIAKQAAVVIENARLHEQLQEQAITDYITGLFNHRHIHERLEEEFARAARSESPFAVMMMDVDKFKEFNDTYGHVQGDEALRFIGQKLRETLRAADIVGRYGGDEFLAILPDATREAAEEAGQRIMSMLAGTPFSPDYPEQSVALAMSIGIACYPKDSQAKDELVMFADAALYEAKRLGGNRAVPASGATLRRKPSPKKMTA